MINPVETLGALAAARLADAAEAAAFVDLYAGAPPPIAHQLGLATGEVGGATALIASALPAPMFNRVIGLGMRGTATRADLDAIEAVYADHGQPSWWLHWNPQAAPAGFTDTLAERGYAIATERPVWAKFVRSSADPPEVATSLTIERVGDEDAAAATAAAVASAFAMPPVIATWLACIHDRPGWGLYAVRSGIEIVGGGLAYIRDDVAWLGAGGMIAAQRGRGGQAALLAARIADCVAAGARWVVTETGLPVAGEPNPSLGNIRGAGFVCVAERGNLIAPVRG